MPASKKKILILGSYPIARPLHGGQKRVSALVNEYKKRFAEVKFVAVFSRWANPIAARSDIPVSHHTDRLIMDSVKLEDIICGESIFTEAKVKKRLSKLLREFRPDIIQIEQVYVYIGLKPLLEELNLNPKLVFDTHNVESAMKRLIYKDAGVRPDEITALVERLAEFEHELIQRAELTVAVSPADLATYKALGARSAILSSNGIYPAYPSAKAVADWRKHSASERINHTFLYVASAHLPNWTGFTDIIGDNLGFLAPDSRILIAGGLSDFLTTRHKWPATPGAATFWLRAEGCGILSEESLSGLLSATNHIILPITTGGGSNLKTAEALLSGKPIIATSYAFRAYEEFIDLPTVTIADTPEDFRAAMDCAVSAPPASLTPAQAQSLAAVTWPRALSSLVQAVAAL
jgi:glycosyltransferase involved in cell wall biosynthesis